MAKRSYPTSQVRGSDREELPTSEVGVAAERSYSVSEARGGSQECQAATAQEQPRRATPPPEARGYGQEEQPHVQGEWLRGTRRA